MPKSLFAATEKAPFGRLFFVQLLALLGGALWVTSWLNPNHYPPWIVFENEACAFIALIFTFIALQLLVQPPRQHFPKGSLLWILAIIVGIAVQYCVSLISWQQAFLGMLYLTALGLAFLVGCQIRTASGIKNQEWEAIGCFAILLVTVLSAGVVLIQYFRVDDAYPVLVASRGVFRPFGNLGQPNNQATFLAMGLVCLDILMRGRRVGMLTAVAILLVLIPALAATDSRAGLVGALCAACCLQYDGETSGRKFTIAWGLMLLTVFLAMPEVSRLFQVQPGRSGALLLSDNSRFIEYKQLLKALFEQPWTGYGFGRTGYAQSMITLNEYAGHTISNAHNLLLELLLWFGIPIGLTLIFSGVVLAFRLRAGCRHSSRLAYCLLIPFVVHSMLELPYAYGFFLLTVGLIVGYLSQGSRNAAVIALSNIHVVALCLFVAGGGSVVLYEYANFVESFTLARFESRKLGSLPKEQQFYQPYVLKDLKGMLDATRVIPDENLSTSAIENLSLQALEYHIPLAHLKLISYFLITRNSSRADEELRRFRNLYDTGTNRWAGEALQNDFCPEGRAEGTGGQCALIRSHLPWLEKDHPRHQIRVD